MTTIRQKTSLFVIVLTFISILMTSSFVDADELTGRTLEPEMREMIEKGILNGYEDGSIRPGEKVTRGQFAAFIARALDDLPEGNGSFIDVSATSKLAPEIYKVSQAGLMQGYSDNTFKPYDLITREQVAITIQNVLEYSGMTLTENRVVFTDASEFISSVGIRAVYYSSNYEIIKGIPNEDGTSLRFEPQSTTTREQAAAFISRFLKAKENYTPGEEPEEPGEGETPPPPPEEPETPVDPNVYHVATIENGQLVKGKSIYNTYEQAAAAFKNNSKAQGLYKGNELIRIKSGLAYAADTKANTTSICTDPSFSKQATYIQEGRELRYIDSNDDFVKVQVGATVGYAKHSTVGLVPLSLVEGRDYYIKNDEGLITHYLYNYISESYAAYQFLYGPSTMDRHVKYYSHDGVHFANEKGELQFTFYPYFQYLSVRSTTNYTAEELNSYISNVLLQRERTGLTKYKDASTKSKIIGIGQYLKEMEATYKVNALFILGAAIHESDYGISGNALEKNNLFGIKVYDSNLNAGTRYDIPQDSINAFVNQYMNKNYIPPTGSYAYGAVPGNKTTGFNVMYPSDPTWGSKIAGHMFRIDQALGQKDLNFYQLARTNYSGSINVRTSPDAANNSNILFTYKPKDLGFNDGFGYPLVIVEEVIGTDGHVWYKVLSDALEADYGYIRSDLVSKISF